MGDSLAREQLKKKKKAASKVLVRFVRNFSGDETATAVLAILTRVDAFALTFQNDLVKSADALPMSNPVIE